MRSSRRVYPLIHSIVQIHGVIGPHSWASLGKSLAECQKLGLCKQVGVSNFNKDQLCVPLSRFPCMV